jgi:hypothetical protein
MTDSGQINAARDAIDSSTLILQIDRPGGGPALQFPAMVRNIAGGVITLEVNNPWTVVNWETLKDQGGCLRLSSSETGESIEVGGAITWVKYTVKDQENSLLNLRLKLTKPDPATLKLISGYIPRISGDIKEFWDRWEQVQQISKPEKSSNTTGFVLAAILLVGGLACQLMEPKGYQVFGWVLWLFGTLVVAGQTLRFWKSRKASR